MQQLHSRRRVAVGVVGVHAKTHRGVGQVARIRNRPDVKQATVIGDPHETQAVADFGHRVGFARHAAQQAEAQRVVALAEWSDGRVLEAINEVKVTIGGCGG